jgi:hypothetical protein
MVNGKSLLTALCVYGCLLGGCGRQEQIETVERICVDTEAKQYVMQAAQDVLGRMQFRIDKADGGAGYIRTLPLEGGQFFEFWRGDNVGGHNFGESNLHTLRRIVELEVRPQGGQVCVEGEARTYRLSLPESEQLSVTQAYEVFTRDQTRLQQFRLSDEQKENMGWIELGVDEALTTEILRRIESAVKEGEGGEG